MHLCTTGFRLTSTPTRRQIFVCISMYGLMHVDGLLTVSSLGNDLTDVS